MGDFNHSQELMTTQQCAKACSSSAMTRRWTQRALGLAVVLSAGCSNSTAPQSSQTSGLFNLPPSGDLGTGVKVPDTSDAQTAGSDDAISVADGQVSQSDASKGNSSDGSGTINTDSVTGSGETNGSGSGDTNGSGSGDGTGTKPDGNSTGGSCTDEDGDGFGDGCDAGPDCDDYNPNFNTSCPDCSQGNVPGCGCKGKSVPCYSADSALVGKGICKAGVQACKNGFWGECIGEVDPGPEICDGLDNNCDGSTDEGVKSSCGGCDLSCVQKGVGAGTDNSFTLNSENSSGVGLDDQGNIKIDSSQISLSLKFLWAANSGEDTVSKVDCKTVKEVGRYKVCNNPSRTSVDLDGNVWVACRGDGHVAKIISDKKNCIDKNGNGVIETSQDANGDGGIDANEMVGAGQPGADECVKFIVAPKGNLSYPGSRGAAVDKFNNVWIAYFDMAHIVHLGAADGAVLDDVDLQGCNPYGLVVDQKGVVWAQGTGCGKLVSWDPVNKVLNKYGPGAFSYGAYGINVDGKGRIWMGGCSGSSGASSYDPKTGAWIACPGVPCSAGIATANDGYVYPAHDGGGGGAVSRLDGEACWQGQGGAWKGYMKTGGSPHGVAVDFDGFVWGVNLTGNSVGKVDPNNMNNAPVVRQIGNSPYTYSDMTGYTLNYFTAPKGLYTTTFFAGGGGNPVSQTTSKAEWTTLDMKVILPPQTKVHVRVKAANTLNELDNAAWLDIPDFTDAAQLPFDLTTLPQAPITGAMLKVEINLITDDKKVTPAVSSLSAKAKLQ